MLHLSKTVRMESVQFVRESDPEIWEFAKPTSTTQTSGESSKAISFLPSVINFTSPPPRTTAGPSFLCYKENEKKKILECSQFRGMRIQNYQCSASQWCSDADVICSVPPLHFILFRPLYCRINTHKSCFPDEPRMSVISEWTNLYLATLAIFLQCKAWLPAWQLEKQKFFHWIFFSFRDSQINPSFHCQWKAHQLEDKSCKNRKWKLQNSDSLISTDSQSFLFNSKVL